jgi:CRP/FNR family transcriptional regulator
MQRKKTGSDTSSPVLPTCSVCSLHPACQPWNLEPEDLRSLERIVERSTSVPAGQHLFRFGEALQSLYVVRSGAFKNYRVDSSGRERVLGFLFAGELVGIDGIYPRRHEFHAVALTDATVCSLPYTSLTALMERSEGLRRQIFRLVSKVGVYSAAFSAHSTAEERVVGMLMNLSNRNRINNRSASQIELPMSREDMGNYLRVPAETVTGVLTYLERQGLIELSTTGVKVLDMSGLNTIIRHK